MKHLRKFSESSDDDKLWMGIQHEYSIYDWVEDLKSFRWGHRQKSRVNINSLKSWSNHFIGDGWFDKISNHVNDIFNSLKKADVDYVNDRMMDIYDDFAIGKEKYTIRCVLNGDVEKHDEPIRRRFNGIQPVNLDDENDKIHTIVNIIQTMVQPTLSLGSFKDFANIRTTNDEVFVTDKKYQCQNFNIENYQIYYSILYQEKSPFSDLVRRKYNINLYLDMYQPGITISIGGNQAVAKDGFNLRKLESRLDEILPSILHDLDYKEVIFDAARFDRKFDDNTEMYDYTVKILLNI
jgi:hypothetical protein